MIDSQPFPGQRKGTLTVLSQRTVYCIRAEHGTRWGRSPGLPPPQPLAPSFVSGYEELAEQSWKEKLETQIGFFFCFLSSVFFLLLLLFQP